jgi:hypothetical protein
VVTCNTQLTTKKQCVQILFAGLPMFIF